MANGTLKDEATYFGNSEKYTGDSGTSTNKYIIEDCYDFIAVVSSQASSYARIVADIDFNEHETYRGGFDNVELGRRSSNGSSHKYIYGDGHQIKNITTIGTTRIHIYYIENCHFINLSIVDCSDSLPIYLSARSGSATVDGTAYKCSFGIYSARSYFQPKGTFNDSTFTIKGNVQPNDNDDALHLTYASMNRCHIKLDITTASKYLMYRDSTSKTFNNSWVTGKVKSTYSDVCALWSSFKPKASYFAFEFINENGYGMLLDDTTNGATCFIDSELFSKHGATLSKSSDDVKINVLTTAQSKDNEYLSSIGYAAIPIKKDTVVT